MFARFLTFRSVLGEKMPTPIDAKLAKERRPQTQTHTEEPRVQDDDPENLFCVFSSDSSRGCRGQYDGATPLSASDISASAHQNCARECRCDVPSPTTIGAVPIARFTVDLRSLSRTREFRVDARVRVYVYRTRSLAATCSALWNKIVLFHALFQTKRAYALLNAAHRC